MALCPLPFHDPGTVLYIGAHKGRFETSKELHEAGNEITVLDIWPDALEGLKTIPRFERRITHYALGDVRAITGRDLPYPAYDYVFWLHGPEHVEFADGIHAIQRLETIAKKVIVLSCPWGYASHGFKENPNNRHVSYWLQDDFSRLGYRVACLGPKWTHGGQLIGWKGM